MTILNPIWLWALSALAIPVGIHLLSRKEGNTIRIGSIRFLTETSTSKFSSIRLNEIILLIVRSLLVLLVTLFLGSLILSSINKNTIAKWAVVENGLEKNPRIKNLLDSLQKNDYEIRALTTDFPLLNSDTSQQTPDYYKLAEQLAQKKTQVIVISSNHASGFKGKRIALPDNIRWLSPAAISSEGNPRESIVSRDTLHIAIVFSNEFLYDKKILIAALRSIETIAPEKIITTEINTSNSTLPVKTDWVVWLSSDLAVPPGKLLRYDNRHGTLILQESKDSWILTKRLDAEIAVNEHLSIQLMDLLFHNKTQQALSTKNSLSIPNELVWSDNDETRSANVSGVTSPTDRIFMILIVLTFLAERILAFYRKQ